MEPSRMRTLEEVISDRLLLLFLISDLRKKGMQIRGTEWQNQFKTLKLTYFSEIQMYERQYKAFNYTFYKWKDGPYAQELLKDLEHLKETKLLRFRHTVELTEESNNLIQNIDKLINNADEAYDIISRTNNEHGPLWWNQLKDIVYSTKPIHQKYNMSKIKNGTLILPILEKNEAKRMIKVNPDWMDTLEIIFDPDLYNDIKTTIAMLEEDQGKDLDEIIKTLKIEL